MTIYDLRKSIIVTSFGNNSECAKVCYSINGQKEQIDIRSNVLKNELIAIGSVDEDICDNELKNYPISQWDAINIAIRHEYAKYMEADLLDSDLFKAIANITKPTNK